MQDVDKGSVEVYFEGDTYDVRDSRVDFHEDSKTLTFIPPEKLHDGERINFTLRFMDDRDTEYEIEIDSEVDLDGRRPRDFRVDDDDDAILVILDRLSYITRIINISCDYVQSIVF